MAKKKETVEAKAEKKASVLLSPRITEKAAIASESKGVYVFNVAKDATKTTIARAIKAEHKVTPVKVAIVNLPARRVVFRGRRGVQGGSKKAYVYLKKGDKISLA